MRQEVQQETRPSASLWSSNREYTMKYLKTTSICGAILLYLMSTAGASGQAVKYAQSGMGFLQIAPSADVAALGGTYAGTTGKATSVFSNPAGLASLEGGEVSAGYVAWIADIALYSVAAAYKIGNIGVFGVNLVSMDYGTLKGTRPWQAGDDPGLRDQGYISLGNFTVNDLAVGISYARAITSQFYVGGNIRVARQDLSPNINVAIIDAITGNIIENSENVVTNVVFDFGTLYYPGFHDLRFGASLRNFSNQSDYYDQRFELPLTLDFGLAMDVFQLFSEMPDQSNSQLTLALDWVHPRDFSERLHVGLEYGFMEMFFLRGGYKFNYDEESVSAGLGVNLKTSGGYGIRADYSYSAFGDFFGSANRLSVAIQIK